MMIIVSMRMMTISTIIEISLPGFGGVKSYSVRPSPYYQGVIVPDLECARQRDLIHTLVIAPFFPP